jgi:hypothetical protein
VVVISVVQVATYDALVQRIANLRSRLHLPPLFEFHWAKLGWRERDAYIGDIQIEDFRCWTLIVNKAEVPGEYQRLSPNEVLCLWIAELFSRLPSDVASGAELVIDDGTQKQRLAQSIRVAVSSSLRERGVERRLGGARGLPAHRSEALQLADMIAGAIRASRVEGTRRYEAGLGAKVVVIEFGE